MQSGAIAATVDLCGSAFYFLLRAIRMNDKKFMITLQGGKPCHKGGEGTGESSPTPSQFDLLTWRFLRALRETFLFLWLRPCRVV